MYLKGYYFCWKIMNNIMPTGDNFRHRDVIVPNWDLKCPFCGLVEESVSHVLFWCDKVRDIWNQCYSWLNVSTAFPVSAIDHFWQHCSPKVSEGVNKKWRILWNAILWVLWNWRNNVVFRNAIYNRDKVINDILFHSRSWIKT